MFCKVYKENQKELEKCTTSILFVKVMNLIYNKNKQGKIDFSILTFFVSPFFPQVFSMFLSLKANLILYAK